MQYIPFAILFIVVQLSTVADAGEIMINNSAIEQIKQPIVMPVKVIQPITNVSAARANELSNIRIPRDLILESVAQFPELETAITERGITLEDIDLPELRDIIVETGYVERYAASNLEIITNPIVTSSEWNHRFSREWNARAIVSLVATGVIDVDHIFHGIYDGVILPSVRFNQRYSTGISSVHTRVQILTHANRVELASLFEDLLEEVDKYDEIQRALMSTIGNITMGHPIVYTREEMSLTVPRNIQRNFDVYWMELAVTFHDFNTDDLAEMVVNFVLPDGAIALELVPLELGQEIDVTERHGTPAIGAEFRGAKVTVGQIF